MEVDHIDRNPFNQRWNNLREVTRRQNMQNTKRARSGAYKSGNTWYACIFVAGRRKSLGYFSKEKEAKAAYLAACAAHGFAYLPELVRGL
jgi:hypothetical protein